MSDAPQNIDLGEYKHGFSYPDQSVFKPAKGLNEAVVRAISQHKNEPDWMLQFRLQSLQAFNNKPMPNWGGDLSDIDFDEIYYYAKPTEESKRSWEDLPEDIKKDLRPDRYPRGRAEVSCRCRRAV